MNISRKLLFIAIAGLAFASCKNTEKEVPTTEAKTTEVVAPKTENTAIAGKIETASFHIEGMSCAVMCAAKIEKELANLDGVQKATVDFDKKTATVEYDSAKQSPEKLVKTVEGVAGGELYKVSDVKSTADQAMVLDQEKVKAEKTTKTKAKETTTKATTEKSTGKCCSADSKKSCSADKKAQSM